MIKIPVENHINVLPPEMKKKYLPYHVLRVVTGGRVITNYENKSDVVAIEWNGETSLLHKKDWAIVEQISKGVWKDVIETKNLLPSLYSPSTIINILSEASSRIERVLSEDKRKRIMFVKDDSGCGYWRMVYPARYMDEKKYAIDCNQIDVTYDFLLEYETIVVQRQHRWSAYYVIEKLKKAGKKIVYDIDDDIFNIPAHNPAFKFISSDDKEAAKAIMGIADVIVTPSEVIKERFGFPEKTIVIPNSVDLTDGWPVLTGDDTKDLQTITAPDYARRIFWQGSATHEEDWRECIDAVENIIKKYDDVRLTILGFLPGCLRERIEQGDSCWNGKVEYDSFKQIETYVSILKQIRGHVGICPLGFGPFNEAKSCLKYVELTAIGMPTIASNVTPYKEIIKNGENGYLANTQEEWEKYLEKLLNDDMDRLNNVRSARQTVSEKFNILSAVRQWESVL